MIFGEFLELAVIKFYQDFGIHGKVTIVMLQGLIMVIP